MGVMSCSRTACDNIMCDTYVDGVGYVCNDCQKEFKEYLSKEGINATTEKEIRRALEKFMETRKDDYTQGNEMDVVKQLLVLIVYNVLAALRGCDNLK